MRSTSTRMMAPVTTRCWYILRARGGRWGRADGVRGGCQDGASARTRDGGGRTYRLIICFSVPLARPIDVSAVPSCSANK